MQPGRLCLGKSGMAMLREKITDLLTTASRHEKIVSVGTMEIIKQEVSIGATEIKKQEGFPMAKAMSVILGLAFLTMGILGITNAVALFAGYSNYVNVGEIVLGGLGLLTGVFSRV